MANAIRIVGFDRIMKPFIPYARQTISDQDIEAVTKVLKSDFLTQGPEVEKFEKRVCETVGARHTVAVSSATAALHLAMTALGVQSKDRVWTSPNTFVATSNAALYCGANPDFIDIDPETLNMDMGVLEEKLIEAKGMGTLPSVVIPVHFAGLRPEMEKLWELAKHYGFRVIEDASHAMGSLFHEKPLASETQSDALIFSFHAVKNVTTGEGGAVVTNDPHVDERVRTLRTHGVTRDPSRMLRKNEGPWYYEQLALGFNYRMTDLQAALGSSQLEQLPSFIQKRNNIAQFYRERLSDLSIRMQIVPKECRSAYHLFVLWIDAKDASERRRRWFDFLRASDIGVNVHYIPVYRQPYYQDLGPFFPCPTMDRYYAGAITLPMYPELKPSEMEYIVQKVREGLDRVP